MGKMYELLKEGLEEAIAYEKGLSRRVRVRKLRLENANVPLQPKKYRADDINL